MGQLPVLSGRKIVKILSKLGYAVVRQKGSHMRLAAQGRKPITVPDYKILEEAQLAE